MASEVLHHETLRLLQDLHLTPSSTDGKSLKRSFRSLKSTVGQSKKPINPINLLQQGMIGNVCLLHFFDPSAGDTASQTPSQ